MVTEYSPSKRKLLDWWWV